MRRTIEGKVVVLGSQGVGKTSIVMRYVGNRFNDRINPTIGASFFMCKLNLEDVKIKLQVWDTAGQERFRSMAPMYYRNTNAALLVFDLTQYNTFSAIKIWVMELKRNVETQMILALVGNKCDLTKERQVNGDEAKDYATKIGASYHETCVHYNEGIEGVFLTIANGLVVLCSDDKNANLSLRVYDSPNSDPNDSDMPPSPSIEESPQKINIAHGIREKPSACC